MGETIASRAATAMERAAEMLETGELVWIQNQLKTYNYGPGGEIMKATGACLIGSIGEALREMYGAKWATHVHRYTVPALMKATGHQIIARWNDDPERTKEQVVDALKTAAKDLRNSADPS